MVAALQQLYHSLVYPWGGFTQQVALWQNTGVDRVVPAVDDGVCHHCVPFSFVLKCCSCS